VLTHGLWVTRHTLFLWRRQFERRGVEAVAFGYPSREPLADNTRRFAAFVNSQPANNIYLLGHSLGGLLILRFLAQRDAAVQASVRRAVLAGSPAAGSESARRLARWRYGRWLLGGAAPALGRAPQSLSENRENRALAAEVGVIAGSHSVGLGRLMGRLPVPNDGAIQVAETRFFGSSDSIVLPLSHSGMLLSSEIVAQSLAFFASGSFDHHASSTTHQTA
jgi:pimeloyl-ACP methyl ester carboxylesterase